MIKLISPTNGQSAEARGDHDDAQPVAMPGPLLKDLAQLSKLLADETRLRILHYLTQCHELHVRAICDLLHESQPAVSHHLALMHAAGLIERRRAGKHNYYSLQTGRFTALLDMFFATMPEGNRRVRFENYILSHSPA